MLPEDEGLRLGLAVCEGVPLFVPLLLRVSEGVAVGVHVPLRRAHAREAPTLGTRSQSAALRVPAQRCVLFCC